MSSSVETLDAKIDKAISGLSFGQSSPKQVPRLKKFKDIRLVKLTVNIENDNYYSGDSSFAARSMYEKLVSEGKKPVYTMEYSTPEKPPEDNFFDTAYLNQFPFKVKILLCKIKENEEEISMEELKLAVKHHPQYFTF